MPERFLNFESPCSHNLIRSKPTLTGATSVKRMMNRLATHIHNLSTDELSSSILC